MGFRCSLLGHAYGDSEIERDREERGDEVVVTIREIEICERCGAESVVSENKEVTAVASADEVGGDAPEAGDGSSGGDGDPAADEGGPAVDAAGEPIDEAEDQGPEHDPATDDGVILDDDDDDDEEPTDREYGEWPDAETDHAQAEADPAAAGDDDEHDWPDQEGEDAGYDATTPDEATDPDVEFSGTAPESPPDSGVDAGADAPPADASVADPSDTEPTPDPDDGFTRAADAPRPDVESDDGKSALVCPECGYTDPDPSGSLRQGDICPECRKGYLATRDAADKRNR